MVLKKAWVPAADADPREGKGKAPIDTRRGQMYVVESGTDPFFPRGMVNAVIPDCDSKLGDGESSPEESSSREDDDDDDEHHHSEDDAVFHSDTVVYPNMMEARLRDLVLCGSLCNTASIHHSKDKDSWEAHGDPTEIALQVSGFG